jgi:hypothetical protein
LPGPLIVTTVMSAAVFLAGIGVNTHIPYTDGGYADLGNVIADLNFLGVRQVRDTISDGQQGSAPLSSYIALAKAGVRFTFLVKGPTAVALREPLTLIGRVQRAVPGSVTAIEGPNEINNWPIAFNGVTGLQGALAMQAALYQAVHSDPDLAGVPVDYLTGYNAGKIGMGPDPATTPGLADYDNQHPYPNNGEPPGFWVSRAQALRNTASPTAPAVFTETGYSSTKVDAQVQARYTLDLIMDAAREGVAKTYLYELMDAYRPKSGQDDSGYGLFDINKAPKPAALAIHNLTAVAKDAEPGAAGFQPAPLRYTVLGLPARGHSLALQKSDGTYLIAVWAEPQLWNNVNKSRMAPPTQTVTVALPARYARVQVFDPLIGATPIATAANVDHVALAVTDHPILVQLAMRGAPPAPAAKAPVG